MEIISSTINFKNDIAKLIPELREAAKLSLIKTGYRQLIAAEPNVPVLEGFLVGANFVLVTGKKPIVMAMPKGTFSPTQEAVPSEGMAPLELRVGFRMPYALRLHENPFEPGPVSKQKGLSTTYKFLSKAIDSEDWGKLTNEFFADEVNKL